MSPKVTPIDVRFWRFVDRAGSCWIWLSTVDKDGYGKVWYNKQQARAHRVSWMLAYGSMPKSTQLVCHTCDTPGCVRPSHLFLGSGCENQQDSVSKRRHREVRKTHCPSGHEFNLENTRRVGRKRRCRTCDNIRSARAYRERKDSHERSVVRG
jgi:hypothetical protein